MKHIFQKIPRSTYLFISVLVFIFLNPLLVNNTYSGFVVTFVYSIMFITTIIAISKEHKAVKYLLYLAILSQIILLFSDNIYTSVIIFVFSGIMFTIVSSLLIRQIAKTKIINTEIVIDAVSGYLLLGVIATILNSIIIIFDHSAISINTENSFADIIYYSFVTLTTIGYGEIIPISAMARNVSVLTGILGQLYLTIIIALIIGKLSNIQQK